MAGPLFSDPLITTTLIINDVAYVVASVTSPTELELTEDAGFALGAKYTGPTLYTSKGDVGDDAGHSRAQIFANSVGTQLFIVSAGFGYVADGLTIYRAQLKNGEGTVTTSGTAVTRVSGNEFDPSLVGNTFLIDGARFTVASVADIDNLTLNEDAGTRTAPAYSVFPFLTGSVTVSGTTVTWVTGHQFLAEQAGLAVNIGGTAYVVSTVTDDTHLELTEDAGTIAETYYGGELLERTGTVETSHTGVTLQSGDNFDGLLVGRFIRIAGVIYTVASVQTASDLLLKEDAGIQTAPAYVATTDLRIRMGGYLNGHFIAQVPDSNDFLVSPVGDASLWDPLDKGTKEGAPDRLLAILTDHQQLWLMGYETGEVWNDTGTGPANGLARSGSGVIQEGISAPISLMSLDGGIAWIGADAKGRGVAFRAQGFEPVRISTHAIESEWARYATLQDCEGYPYQEGGHQFGVFHFPSAKKTWVYDATSNSWAERNTQNPNGTGTVDTAGTAVTWASDDQFDQSMAGELFRIEGFDYSVASVTDATHLILTTSAGTQTGAAYEAYRIGRQRQRVHAHAFEKHLVGDWENGRIYDQSLDYVDDDGSPILRGRNTPHVSSEQKTLFYHWFQLDMQVGVGDPEYTDLAIDGADNTKMASAAHPFTTRDIGMWLSITAGTGFTVQRVKLLDVIGNLATASQALGSVGSIDGSATPDAPLMKLQQSKNNGKRFQAARSRSAGMADEDIIRVLWNRLDSSRNMTFRVSSTARIQHCWVDALLGVTVGLS